MNPEIVLSVNRVTKRFGRLKALDSVSFEVKRGEALALWGPNGAGKTTLLKSILGIISFEGDINVMGFQSSRQGKEVRRSIGYIPQDIRFHGDQSVFDALVFFASLRQVPIDRARKLLADWGLQSVSHKPIQTLSGGMKQKFGLVIALLSEPPILLMDEPTSHLDVQSRHDFHVLLEDLRRSGKTLIFCTHRISEIVRFSDRMIVLKSGIKVAEAKPDEIRNYAVGETILCVTVRKEDCARAYQLMQDKQLDVRRNAAQLWVQVPNGRKSEPIEILLDRGIPVLDFEIDHETELP